MAGNKETGDRMRFPIGSPVDPTINVEKAYKNIAF